MAVDQRVDGEVVGYYRPVKAPFLAQNPGEKLLGTAARDTVDLVVAVHDRGQFRFPHGRFERIQVHFAKLAPAQMGRCPVHPAFRHPVADKVFGGRHYAASKFIPLESLDVAGSQARHQVRVFAKRLFDPAPARVAGDVE